MGLVLTEQQGRERLAEKRLGWNVRHQQSHTAFPASPGSYTAMTIRVFLYLEFVVRATEYFTPTLGRLLYVIGRRHSSSISGGASVGQNDRPRQ